MQEAIGRASRARLARTRAFVAGALLVLGTSCGVLLARDRAPAAADVATTALPADAVARLHFIDVGSGDATVIETACAAWLVDAGGPRARNQDRFLAYLERFFAARPKLGERFEAVIVTHSHRDHTGGVLPVLERYGAGEVVWNGRATIGQVPIARWLDRNPSQHDDVQWAPRPGEPLRVDRRRCHDDAIALSYLWGGVPFKPGDWGPAAFADENNHSIVLRVDAGSASALLPGDLERSGLRGLMVAHGSRALDVDVLKISHHGYASGSTPAFVRATSPEVAVVSRSKRPWNDPTLELYEREIDRRRPAPLAIRSYTRTDVPRGASRGVDASGRRIRWGITHGRIVPDSVESAIYITAYDGTVAVDLMRGGGAKVTTERGEGAR